VRAGDRLVRLADKADVMRWLPEDVWKDLASRAAARDLRARLEAAR
jgi:hypothetical protein